MIKAADVKKLRDQTGAPMMKAKEALQEARGNVAKATEILRKKGAEIAADKADRQAKEGVIASYIHSNNKIGVIVELNCETDFVARDKEFQQLGKDIAMQVAAMTPLVVSPEDIDDNILDKEREVYMEQIKKEKKPDDIKQKIVEGKLKKFAEENSLLKQSFIKDEKRTIEDLITDFIGKFKENVQVGRFVRFEIGHSPTISK
ncbi:translation elongation factor Ts [Patescibacteria group bacterium]